MEEILRAGIISDVHIGYNGLSDPRYFGNYGMKGCYGDRQREWWKYALCWFKQRGVDLIIVPGDMADGCDYDEWKYSWKSEKAKKIALEEIREFKSVFDEVFSTTGTKLITIYGNHDNAVQLEEIKNGGFCSHWSDIFKEEYEPVIEKEVKGYRFVAAHWGHEKNAAPAIEKAAKGSFGKYAFYIQHPPLAGTTHDSLPEKEEPSNVRDFENLIILTGHTHTSIVNERAIFQPDGDSPAYAAVNCSSLNYGFSRKTYINGDPVKTKHALYMTVSGKSVVFERLSFLSDEMISLVDGKKKEQDFEKCVRSCGDDWVLTIGERKYGTETRKKLSVPPEFGKTASAGINISDTWASLSFPAAENNGNIHSYSVEVFDTEGNKVSENAILSEHHTDASGEYYADYYTIAVGGLLPGREYIFKIYARDWYFNKCKRPLEVKAKTEDNR